MRSNNSTLEQMLEYVYGYNNKEKSHSLKKSQGILRTMLKTMLPQEGLGNVWELM